jgi:hypothetical protein
MANGFGLSGRIYRTFRKTITVLFSKMKGATNVESNNL